MKLVDVTTIQERELVVFCECGEELTINDAQDDKTEINVEVLSHECKETQK